MDWGREQNGKIDNLPILLEGVDSQNGQILVLLGISHEELVGHLLHHNILGDGDLYRYADSERPKAIKPTIMTGVNSLDISTPIVEKLMTLRITSLSLLTSFCTSGLFRSYT